MAYIGQKPANKAVVADDLDPTVITGQTALTDKPADTDEFLISDAGTLKRIDASLVGGGAVDWQSTIVTGATHTVSSGQGIWIDTSSNACTLTLPASPSVGDQVIFTDYARNWGTNAVTLNLNSEKFQGSATPVPIYDTNGESVNIVYSGSTKGWIPNSDGAVALETPQTYSADFLVIAGAGGGSGGAGGAGGYRTSTQTLNVATVYTITVGDGGAASGATSGTATSGSNSSISGSGLTTITSAGGGGGGGIDSSNMANNTGLDGGSGGGSGRGSSGTATNSGFGSGNTPSTSPSQGNNGGAVTGLAPYYGAGGGGGAGGVGANGTGSGGGNGGVGTASSITGSSVTRAGGGGGAANNTTAGSGGTGGGGNGVAGGGTGANGTANTGGGGGGSDGSGGSGGKGVVILSVPTASYSGTTSGSPTVTTSGANTIMQFNGSGSYTG
jgi:hypothetical protein